MSKFKNTKIMHPVEAKANSQLKWAVPVTCPSDTPQERFERIQTQLEVGSYVIDKDKLARKILPVLTSL